jgi:hypothetical protein
MGRDELPAEFDGTVGWEELLKLLGSIDGEHVFVTARANGVQLRTQGLLRAMEVGPSEAAYELAGATGLPASSFSFTRRALMSARLLTMDGNDNFRLLVDSKGLSLVVADADSGP